LLGHGVAFGVDEDGRFAYLLGFSSLPDLFLEHRSYHTEFVALFTEEPEYHVEVTWG
jgi:hypothetical protein